MNGTEASINDFATFFMVCMITAACIGGAIGLAIGLHLKEKGQ